MKKFNSTVLEPNVARRSSPLVAPALVIAALMIGNPSFADESGYQVVLGDVAGADDIVAGNILAGIKILEEQLNLVEQENSGDILSALCAAYIINDSLNQAERACTKAVEIDPSHHALNNRGAFHIFTGDLIRAREDFERVRQRDVEAYLDNIKTTNVRLVSASNFDRVNQKLAKHTDSEAKSWPVLSTAEIEDLND